MANTLEHEDGICECAYCSLDDRCPVAKRHEEVLATKRLAREEWEFKAKWLAGRCDCLSGCSSDYRLVLADEAWKKEKADA